MDPAALHRAMARSHRLVARPRATRWPTQVEAPPAAARLGLETGTWRQLSVEAVARRSELPAHCRATMICQPGEFCHRPFPLIGKVRLAFTRAQSPEALDVESALAVALRHDKEECMRNGRAILFALTIFVLYAATELYPADTTGLEPSRDSILRIVFQIQRADYEGDRPALKRLHDELTP